MDRAEPEWSRCILGVWMPLPRKRRTRGKRSDRIGFLFLSHRTRELSQCQSGLTFCFPATSSGWIIRMSWLRRRTIARSTYYQATDTANSGMQTPRLCREVSQLLPRECLELNTSTPLSLLVSPVQNNLRYCCIVDQNREW